MRAAAVRASAGTSPLILRIPNSWTHFCVHTGGSDDRESGWADNNPSSPFFGRMYVSWNDFAVGSGASESASPLTTVRLGPTSDSWPPPALHPQRPDHRRLATGDVYIAGMDEGGGGLPAQRHQHDLSGPLTAAIPGPTPTPAPPSPAPGAIAAPTATSPACLPAPAATGGTWAGVSLPRYNGVVHLCLCRQHGTGGDPGDVFYIRSTDSGVTFSAPFKLNTDTTTRPQWQPNLSVSPSGTLFAVVV